MLTYAPPAIEADEHTPQEEAGAAVTGTIAVILTFFASVLAWCYFVCQGSGGLSSCSVGWFEATAVCNN